MDVVSTQRKIVRRQSFSDAKNEERSSSATTAAAATKSRREERTTTRGLAPRLRRRRRSVSEPPKQRRPIIEDYYRVDHNARFVLPGAPKYGDDWARDVHDFFNLIVLVPIIVLNLMNWNWDMLLDMPKNKTPADAWTGDWSNLFFQVTVMYFLTDLVWVIVNPACVRSPATIIQHHIVTLLYLWIPYKLPHFQWCMGACMSVEINTWFLIARRVFNKQGFSPWVIDLPPIVSIRVKLISIFFYLTWISLRCILYPYLLHVFAKIWHDHSLVVGTRWNALCIVVPLHAAFCLLNIKWTYDLIMSKVRYWRRKVGAKEVSKGL